MRKADIIVIGSGPAGMEVAARALAAGLDTVVIERGELGGTCLNRGCIPTKALCRSAEVAAQVREAAVYGVEVTGFRVDVAVAMARKDAVVAELRANVASMLAKAEIVTGTARLVSPDVVAVDDRSFTAPKIVIATGSEAARLPIPGAELALTSDEILALDTCPERVCVIGGGVIGMEFAGILSAFGAKVTVIEYCREILPGFDKDIAKRLRTTLSRRGVEIITSSAVTAISPGKVVDYECKGKTGHVEADEVLMAVGRRPVVPEGAESAGVAVERRGISVDEAFATAVPGIYAVGDVNGRLMLAHAASAQAANMMGAHMNLSVVPAAVFTSPECAMVGLTEEICKERGLNYRTAKTLFRGNGKAVAMGESDGMVKLIMDTDSRLMLGCHICGPHAADLVQEIATAMSAHLTVDAVAEAIHAHPTLGETVHAAALQLAKA